ncbi:MAG TPA: glycosyltransferase [Pyrinomonadaceae bacterium]|nr:glycosyltransferase [Pyrinomonadaceae bacterium]
MIAHILDARPVWIKEFASALSAVVPTIGWCPDVSNTGRIRDYEKETLLNDPPLRVRSFPLQRGFAKFPVKMVAPETDRLVERLIKASDDSHDAVLISCLPHYASVTEKWPGQVIYYATDLFVAYWDNARLINEFEERSCAAADLVCPNSRRVAEQLIREAHCDPAKVEIIPNATRQGNVLARPGRDFVVPADMSELPRPVAGILGNLGSNTDWQLLAAVIDKTPWLSWVFVGPADSAIPDRAQQNARARVRQSQRVRFVGPKPYAELQSYARAFDLAVLPYLKCEPTYSGSSTRFYEHLPAGRPMIATRGFAELLDKEPLLRLADSSDEMVAAIEELHANEFRDGHEELRWQTSQSETWEARAAAMMKALDHQVARGKRAA